eukprot:TRINITY_DN8891_c0_g1_i2.p1 TRINITY_DN8891_c0_g1~~TRINITY_DN8891_c0_g1_i2.p1  ORF type:complete len:366 (+),score=40.92 TRINITY_DN8891_c0_g1_i2:98-1195(+)
MQKPDRLNIEQEYFSSVYTEKWSAYWKFVNVYCPTHLCSLDILYFFDEANLCDLFESPIYKSDGHFVAKVDNEKIKDVIGKWVFLGNLIIISEEELHIEPFYVAPPCGNEDLFSGRLPTDVQILIVKKLVFIDVVNLAMVSKYWKQIAYSPTVWRSLCVNDFLKAHSSSMNWRNEYKLLLAKYRIERSKKSDLHIHRMYHRHWMMCGVHMFHPVNGRVGFDLLPVPQNITEKPSVEVMKQILKREDELRLSAEVQALFSDPGNDTVHVAAIVQERVAKEFGFQNVEEAVSIIRSVPALYPDHPELHRIPHYQKYNRSKRGSLNVGDTIPDVPLSFLDGAPISLLRYVDKYCTPGKLLVINSGSFS